jgi:hypothetical protein
MASACSNSHPLSSSRYIKCFPIHASRYVADEVVAVVLDFAPPSCRSKRATHRNSGSSGLISSSTLFLPAALRSSILLLVFLTSCCSRAREYVRVVILERGRRVGFFQRVENAAPDGGLFFYFLTVVRRSTSPLPSSRVCRFQSCRWFLRVQEATWDSVGQTTRHFPRAGHYPGHSGPLRDDTPTAPADVHDLFHRVRWNRTGHYDPEQCRSFGVRDGGRLAMRGEGD